MSVNKTILLGNLGQDPKVTTLDSGVKVASFSLATTDRAYKTRDGKEIPEQTEWHNLVLWRGLADIAEKFLKKGDKLYVEGKTKTRSYEDAQGIKRYITEVYVEQLELLTPKPGGGTPPPPTPPIDVTTTTTTTEDKNDLPL